MLQENAWTGLFFIAGIFCGSLFMGMAAIAAVIISTYTAKLLHYDKIAIDKGLYGFNATLVGVALAFLFHQTVLIWMAILTGAVLATIIQHFFISRKIPVFTFPFILVTWMFLFIFHYFPCVTQAETLSTSIPYPFISMLLLGYGQIIFQNSIIAGILFFAGVCLNRPVAAIYGLGGAALSGCIAYLLHMPANDLFLGLLSYNGVLCAICFSGRKTEDLIKILLSVSLSVPVFIMMKNSDLPVLTFPFVLASWITLWIKKIHNIL